MSVEPFNVMALLCDVLLIFALAINRVCPLSFVCLFLIEIFDGWRIEIRNANNYEFIHINEMRCISI